MAANAKNNQPTESTPPKVEKYLTNIKELPTFSSDAKTPEVQEKKVEYKTHVVVKPEVELQEKRVKKLIKEEKQSEERVELPKTNVGVKLSQEKGSSSIKPYSTKDIILTVVNVITLVLLFIFLSKLSTQAENLKDLKNEYAIGQTPLQLEFSDIQKAEVKADELDNLFVDEPRVVEFVNDVEKLRNEESSQIQVSFASQKAVKDKTQNYGIPVVITLRGSWEQIGNDLGRIQKLPYLFRSVKVTSKQTEDPGVIEFKYGIVLYVKDELGED